MVKKKTMKSTAKKATGEVIYEKPSVKLYGGEKPPITCSIAKKFLGWEEETEKEKFKDDFLLRDQKGTKIRCNNNVTNRPLYNAIVLTLMQEHLNKRWQFNGEPIIIGKTGLILNGQHTLISFVLACQEWNEDKEKWADFWKEEPTMEKLCVFGVSEEDEIVNTMDTCKPRSLSDVIYRSVFFQDFAPKDRKDIAKITDYAIKLLWHRTGESLEAFAPRRTHSESLAFIESHPRLLSCIKHIYEENSSGKISNFISGGYAAGLLYLMSTCETDPSEYKETRNEKSLDFSQYEKACDFWVLIAQNASEISALKKSRGKMIEEEWDSMASRLGILCKAWNLYVEDKPITEAAIKLKYTEDEEGYKFLDELPIVDGIDIGDPNEIDESHVDAKDPTKEEIESRKAEERANRKVSKKKKVTAEKAQKKTTKKKGTQKIQVGSVRWVCEKGKEPYRGKIVELSTKAAKMKILHGFQGSGNTAVAQIADLRTSQPRPQEA